MTILDRIYREPAALLAFAAAIGAVLTGADVLSQAGAAIYLGVVAGSVGLLRYVVTPSAEVIVQEKPNGVTRVVREASDAYVTLDYEAPRRGRRPA